MDKAEETFGALKSGVPIVYQAVLWDAQNLTYGSPDFLVRSDILLACSLFLLGRRGGDRCTGPWGLEVALSGGGHQIHDPAPELQGQRACQ